MLYYHNKMSIARRFVVWILLSFLVRSIRSKITAGGNDESESPDLVVVEIDIDIDSGASVSEGKRTAKDVDVDFDLSPLSPLVQEKIHQLQEEAFTQNPNSSRQQEIWEEVLRLHPRSGNAHVQLGILQMLSPYKEEQERGILLLEKAFDPKVVDQAIPTMPNVQGQILASVIGRWRWEQRDYELARKFILLALQHAPHGADVCLATQLATMLHPFPHSTKHADEMIHLHVSSAEKFVSFLQTQKWVYNELQLCHSVPGAANDPYVHCMLSIFHLSFYYRADVRRTANAHFTIATTIWPKLKYVPEQYQNYIKPPTTRTPKPCQDGKIRLGIVSGVFSVGHSVVSDFSGVMKQLDRTIFDISYIYLKERNDPIDPFVYHHENDTVTILTKQQDQDICNGAWLTRYHPIIEKEDLDILFYPDLTMSTHAQRLAMAKLAKVQATSHGHPVTSGIPKEIMDYYISWEAAELEYDTAAHHYTEELLLLPKETMHQYYSPKSDGKRSLVTGGFYSHIKRTDDIFSGNDIPEDGNWYTCMQKPFKFQPEVDELFCGILKQDPWGQLILHMADTPSIQDNFVHRLRNEGCDMSRVHFLPVQPHHILLALYSLSDVVLDSYPAGGCTTTREVLELGKVVVTLPARLLGGRWSYALYQMMGDDVLNNMVVAKHEDDYIDLAVQLGTNNERRIQAEQRIQKNLHKLYGKVEAVKAWEKVFLDIAPVRLPAEGLKCKDEE